jgi:hypothetical protein
MPQDSVATVENFWREVWKQPQNPDTIDRLVQRPIQARRRFFFHWKGSHHRTHRCEPTRSLRYVVCWRSTSRATAKNLAFKRHQTEKADIRSRLSTMIKIAEDIQARDIIPEAFGPAIDFLCRRANYQPRMSADKQG